MKISLVIPVYNDGARIKQCLKAAFSQIEPFAEVIVVDNNCTDNSMAIAKKFPVRIIKEKQQGISYARNAGFNAAKYEIIARTDADSILPPNWVKIVKEAFKTHPEYLAITGPVFFYDLIIKHLASLIHNVVYYYLLKQLHGHYLVIGSNLALRKSAWNKAKKTVIMNNREVHEDLDLSIQIAKFGKVGYVRELNANTSGRRIFSFPSNLEYLTRYFKMVARLFITNNYQNFH